MDLPRDPVREPQDDLLAALSERVALLETHVAMLQAAARQTAVQQGSVQEGSVRQGSVRRPSPPPALETPLPSGDPGAGSVASMLPPPLPADPDSPGLAPDGALVRKTAHKTPPTARSLEDRLGAQVFNRVGIVALLIAASWGLKLAFENQWVGPVGRILIGLLAGAGLVLWSERFRRKGFAAFSYSLKAVGTGVLYLTLWAGFQIYTLLPASVALALMIAVTAWNAFMAWSQDSELLAAYALTGALATPLLLSTGGNHEIFLFTYLGALNLSTLLLLRLKPWPRLMLSALLGTVAFYAGWYVRFYSVSFDYGSPAPPFGVTTAFVLGFATMFALASVRGVLRWKDVDVRSERFLGRSPVILSVLVPLLNAAFLSLALSLSVSHQFQADPLPWLMVVLAMLYLALTRVQRTALSAALHLALAVVFLTIAIPLKASGHTLTIAWFAEGITLLGVSTRVAPNPAETARLSPATVLRTSSCAGYLLGLLSLCAARLSFGESASFLSANLFTALFAAVSFGLAAWLCFPLQRAAGTPAPKLALAAFLGLDAVALLLASHELDLRVEGIYQPFLNPMFGFALVGLVILALSLYGMVTLGRLREDAVRADPSSSRSLLRRVAAGTFILFNLLTILSVEHEINALWHRSEANLQRSLAVPGFLMLYGAVLLTAGFIQRSAFTRWQALALILFTILKVFLYDISSLSQGYRVVSFLGLGVLLMAVSFAYQKDWLGLKTVPSEPQPEEIHS